MRDKIIFSIKFENEYYAKFLNLEDVVTIRVSTEELKEIKVKDFMKLLK